MQHRVGMAQTQPLPLLAALAGRIARFSLCSNIMYLPRCGNILLFPVFILLTKGNHVYWQLSCQG